MATIRLTSKRQATFPKDTCEELGIGPGDTVRVDRRVVEGKTLWVLAPIPSSRPAWFGRFRGYAKGRAHGMKHVRESIEEARRGGRI